jgi:serralysin
MADINLTSGDDRYTQPDSLRDEWNNYFGLEGNDLIRLMQGTAVGGKGNDTLERIPTADWWRDVGVAYWDSPVGARVDLEAGTAEDGWGGRDTLIGINHVHGNGQDNWFKGNAADNNFWGNGGNDTVMGGAGTDRVTIPWFDPQDGSGWRQPRLEELHITVSPDGREASVSTTYGQGFRYTLSDVELIETDLGGGVWGNLSLADFISPLEMARQAIAAGGGQRWNAAADVGTPVTLSYSFVTKAPASGPGAAGFRAFTPAEQQLVRDILAHTAALCGLSFTEVTEAGSTVGQLRFGVSQQKDTRGVAWLPHQAGAGDNAGDVWMDVESMAGIAPGSEGYAALLHEIGHALGLRHPRNVDPGDQWAVQLRETDDRSALTVMSDNYSADGLFRSDWGLLDVLALRWLYGTRAVATGDTVWKLGTRESGVQSTLVDDGGIDTLDASLLTSGVSLSLQDGKLSSVGVSAAGFAGVENLGLPSGSVIEHAIGSAHDDVLLGNALANTLHGGLGNDWLDGGAGSDTASFDGRRADYEVSAAFGKVYVRARDGVSGYDTLLAIETLAFADQALALQPKALSSDLAASVDEDKALSLTLPDASDLPRADTAWRLLGQPAHGSATISADGRLVYTPAANFWGRDAVPFEVAGEGSANRYLVFVDVQPVNDAAPQAANASLLTGTGTLLEGRLPRASDADGDTITYLVATAPRGGTLTINTDGRFFYQSRAGSSGSDSFGFAVSDGMGGSSTYTVTVNLTPVTGQRVGTSGADTLGPATAAEGYTGLGGRDTFTGGGGNDFIDGGDGIDTAKYDGARSRYRLERADTHWLHTDRNGGDGADRLVAVERIEYSNAKVAIDLDGNAGIVAQVVRGIFGGSALKIKEYVGIGLQLVDGGMSLEQLVSLALSTGEFTALAGSRSHRDVVKALYTNVAGKAPSTAELDGLTALLDQGQYTPDSLALLACTHPWNTGSADLVGLAATGIEYVHVPGFG